MTSPDSTRRGLCGALMVLLALLASPAPAAAQKDQMLGVLRPLYTALAGVYGDEGPQITAHVDTLARTLDRWDKSLALSERDLRARIATGDARTALEAHTELASLFAERSRLADAVREIEAALRLDPRRSGLYRFKALLHEGLQQPTQAADAYRTAWLLQPEEPVHAYHLIVHRSAQTSGADVERALTILQGAERELIRGQRGRAVAPFLTLNAIAEDDGSAPAFAPAAYAPAFKQLLSGDFQGALTALRAAVAADPLVADLTTRAEPVAQGLAALRQGNMSAAINHLTAAVALAPMSSEAHRILATAYRVNGDVERSLEHLRESLRLDPGNERSWIALSGMLDEIGRPQDATAAAQKGLGELPAAGALRWVVSVLSAKREQTNDSDLELVRKAETIVLLAGRGDMYGRVARLAQAQLEYDRAIRLLELQLGLTPNNPAAHRSLGAAYVEANNPAAGYAEFVVALWLDPEDAATITALGLQHLGDNDYATARETFARAVALAPSYSAARQGLGQVLVRVGETAEGQKHLDEVARLQAVATQNQRRMRSATVLRLRAEREMSAGQFAEAIATWQELIPMESGYADNHLSLAEALVAEKRLEEAAARLQTAITLKAGIEAHRRLALVYETLGRAADANRVRQMYIERLLQDLRRRAGEI